MSEAPPSTPAWSPPGGGPWASGMVTSTGLPPAPPPEPPSPPGSGGDDGPARRRRQMRIFGGVAGAILAIGLTIILIVALSSDGDALSGDKASAPTDVRPPLAQMCPAPTTIPEDDPTPAPSAPQGPVTGERTVDTEAGISYRKFGSPWQEWNTIWRAGTLNVPYKVGQHFVTEQYSGGSYHASILSAAVPAAENDAVTLNLECVGRQVAADVRAEYYPQPNSLEPLQDKMTTLGGRPAYLSEFRLHFSATGLTATAERSAVAVIDVGKPTAAVLYISIPNTHQQQDVVIAETLASVRPL